MRVFVYEYTCASGIAAHALSVALQTEGWAMLSVLLEDFSRIAGVQTCTLLAEHCRHDYRGGVCRRVRGQDEEAAFRQLAAAADYTLVIAPEFEDILRTRYGWVLESGGRLLGPSPEAVELTADKLALCRHLRGRGVPTPESRSLRPGDEVPGALFPLVWKPRYGAGSQATFLVTNLQEWEVSIGRARVEGWQGQALMQPYVPGEPASVAFLMGPHSCVPLLPAAQRLSGDGRFRYLGGTVPLPTDLGTRAVQVAKRAVETIPELRGYVGVDLVLGPAEDGSLDAVIEINPRPTTSYVGLRALTAINLAQAMLQLAIRDEIPRLVWRPGIAQFDADGTVRLCP